MQELVFSSIVPFIACFQYLYRILLKDAILTPEYHFFEGNIYLISCLVSRCSVLSVQMYQPVAWFRSLSLVLH